MIIASAMTVVTGLSFMLNRKTLVKKSLQYQYQENELNRWNSHEKSRFSGDKFRSRGGDGGDGNESSNSNND